MTTTETRLTEARTILADKMDKQTIEAVEDRLRQTREILTGLVSRRVRLSAELDELTSERDDTHFEALTGHNHETLRRLIALNREVSDLRAEHAALRSAITATMVDLGEAKQ